MKVLGIETSCDETAAAVLDGSRVLSSKVASQDEVHAPFGGVVPELASRRHMEVIVPIIESALEESKMKLDDIDGIAVTRAPGLVGSLLVGISTAKGIAMSRDIPLVGINHLEGHLMAVNIENKPVHPWLGMVVSGGHTSIYLVKGFGDYELIGSTQDDAAGEAFDKVAKLLGLGYPGGPVIERVSASGDADRFEFTRPRIKDGKYDFSFSGIKTSCLLKVRDARSKGIYDDKFIVDLAASFQKAAVGFLVEKIEQAVIDFGAKGVAISGGVAANKMLRNSVISKSRELGVECYIPSFRFCTDNAAMIAYVGGRYLETGRRDELTLNAKANEEIGL